MGVLKPCHLPYTPALLLKKKVKTDIIYCIYYIPFYKWKKIEDQQLKAEYSRLFISGFFQFDFNTR